jgi:hypothetical protein
MGTAREAPEMPQIQPQNATATRKATGVDREAGADDLRRYQVRLQSIQEDVGGRCE